MKNYVIITPARDEAKYISETLESVVNQTIKPSEWIIVDDGSSDNTAEIVEKFAAENSWIKLIKRGDRGLRSAGTGVMEAFYEGYNNIEISTWNFIVKLDGDVGFSSDYFEKCMGEFQKNHKLGIGGGLIHNKVNDSYVIEDAPLFHVRGATKIYKKECWEEIGGLVRTPGWDTLDEVKANMLGWETKTFKDLPIMHYRYTGHAYGVWADSVKNGMGSYILGYHPLFILARSLKAAGTKPYLKKSAGLMWGFILGYIKGIKKVDDKALIRYTRQQQIKKLLLQKSIWN